MYVQCIFTYLVRQLPPSLPSELCLICTAGTSTLGLVPELLVWWGARISALGTLLDPEVMK